MWLHGSLETVRVGVCVAVRDIVTESDGRRGVAVNDREPRVKEGAAVVDSVSRDGHVGDTTELSDGIGGDRVRLIADTDSDEALMPTNHDKLLDTRWDLDAVDDDRRCVLEGVCVGEARVADEEASCVSAVIEYETLYDGRERPVRLQ